MTWSKPISVTHSKKAPTATAVGQAARTLFNTATWPVQLLIALSGAVIRAISNPTASTTTKLPLNLVLVGVVVVVGVVVGEVTVVCVVEVVGEVVVVAEVVRDVVVVAVVVPVVVGVVTLHAWNPPP